MAEPEQTSSVPLALPDEPDWLRSDERPLMLAAWESWAAVLRRLDPAYEIKEPSKLNTRALVAELRGIVGHATTTFDSIYGPRDVAPADEHETEAPEATAGRAQ